ncbi:MAG: hypothetical protein IM526_04690 [Microcystis sp. M38BS1]|nr:hypothetical protein [Microcystis sp. M61BS1]MCA2594438.1 hypothetical protein [Microcystis sp. M38BS1]
MDYVQIRKIGSFQASIGLLLREFIRLIGGAMVSKKYQQQFGMSDLIINILVIKCRVR